MGRVLYLWKGNKTPEGFPQFTIRELRGQPQVFQGDAILPPGGGGGNDVVDGGGGDL